MNDYLQRLVRPAAAAAVRAAPPALHELDDVVPASSPPAAATVAPQAAAVAAAPVSLEALTRWVSAPAAQPQQPDPASAAEGTQPPAAEAARDRVVIDAPAQRPAPRAPAAPQQTLQHPGATAAALPEGPAAAPPFHHRMAAAPAGPADAADTAAARPADPVKVTPPIRTSGVVPLPSTARPGQRRPGHIARSATTQTRPPAREPPGDVVEVHVGSIALTVKAPAPAPAALATSPAPPPATANGAQRPAAPAREGLRFSASRHHLRWS